MQSWTKLRDPEFRNEWYRNYYKTSDFYKAYRKRRIRFRNKRIILSYQIKTGVCSECHKQKITSMHHLVYIPCMPWACTIELCVSCHRKKNVDNQRGQPRIIEGSRQCIDCGSNSSPSKRWKAKSYSSWYAANKEKTQWRCSRCWRRSRRVV